MKNWNRYLLPEKIPEIFVDLYDSFAFKALESYYLETAREIVSYCPRGRILDVGCGPGYLPLQAAKLSEHIRVDGVDLSPKMIMLARNNSRKANLEDYLNFFVSDGNALAIPEQCYDMIISTGVLHSLKNPVAFIDECHRVLKPGKEAWIFDPARIVSSKEHPLQNRWGKGTKLILYAGMVLLIKIFKPRPYSREEVIEMVKKSRFSDYTISGEGYFRIKLKK